MDRKRNMKSVSTREKQQVSEGYDKEAADHFIIKNGVEYSGTHLLVDLWGASHLTNQQLIDIVF